MDPTYHVVTLSQLAGSLIDRAFPRPEYTPTQKATRTYVKRGDGMSGADVMPDEVLVTSDEIEMERSRISRGRRVFLNSIYGCRINRWLGVGEVTPEQVARNLFRSRMVSSFTEGLEFVRDLSNKCIQPDPWNEIYVRELVTGKLHVENKRTDWTW